MADALHASIRWSVILPADLSAQIDLIAEQRGATTNRMIVDLLRDGIAAYDKRRAAFLDLADKFQRSTDPAETEELKEALLKMSFGD